MYLSTCGLYNSLIFMPPAQVKAGEWGRWHAFYWASFRLKWSACVWNLSRVNSGISSQWEVFCVILCRRLKRQSCRLFVRRDQGWLWRNTKSWYGKRGRSLQPILWTSPKVGMCEARHAHHTQTAGQPAISILLMLNQHQRFWSFI